MQEVQEIILQNLEINNEEIEETMGIYINSGDQAFIMEL